MKTKYTRKNRIISMLLCVTLVLGLVLPSGVRANDASKIYDAAELATGGVPLVPAALLEDLSFMGDYVENGGSMSLNSQFSRYKTENADGAGDTLPNGVIDGRQSKAWYASYRWSATREQRDVINRPDVELRFSGDMTPDYHEHKHLFTADEKHWSLSAIRLTRGDGNGGNTWTYGVSDYGHRPNGDIINSYGAKAQADGDPQTVSNVWADYPAGEKELFYNAYYMPGYMCGNPNTSDALFYAVEKSSPTVTGVEFSGREYTSILGGDAIETVTLRFSEKIRFADNTAHNQIKLYLVAEYLEQSGMDGSKTVAADLVEMGSDYMKFQFKITKDYKHVKISRLDSAQPDLMAKTDLTIFGGNGSKVVTYEKKATSVITDLAGNSLVSLDQSFYARYFDGVAPKLSKIEMSGPDISGISTEPGKWTDNAGSRRFIYAGAGDRITIQAVFDEGVRISNPDTARAVLSIKDESGTNITLDVKHISGNTVTFRDLDITEAMRPAGERIRILRFEGMEVADYAGNAVTTNLTANVMVPAQNITLDVDKPQVSSSIPNDQVVSSDPLVYRPYADAMGGEYFSFPVSFRDVAQGSGVAGMPMQFSLELASGGKYGYRWAMDQKQTVDEHTSWANGTTGERNTVKELAEGVNYWVHIHLDPNTDYDYTIDRSPAAPGVYLDATLHFGSVTDWAGNRADSGIRYTLRHQVDDGFPGVNKLPSITLIPDYDNGKVTFSARFAGRDDYSVKKISYRWMMKSYDMQDFEYVDERWTVAEPTEDGLIRELWVEPSYTYDYLAAGGYRYGMVRLEVMVEDEAGNGPSIVKSPAAIFNYLLSSSRSNVVVNDPADPVRVPQVTMTAPHTPSGAQPENTPRSLLIIPIPDSVNEEGRFTEFYIWDPWDWDTNGVVDAKGKMQYTEDPIAAIERYLNGYYDYYDMAEAMRGSYYRAVGTVDPETGSAVFTDLYNFYSYDHMRSLQTFFEEYYGRMDLYIATTSELAEFAYGGYVRNDDGSATLYGYPEPEELSFNGIHTTVDTYTVYVANDATYKIVTESVTDGQGLTDEENTEYQLDYWSGDRPAENLDNVAVAVRITNERDGSAAMGEGFGLQFLDYTEGNGAFRLYYIGDSRPGEEKPDGTPVKTWDLVNSSDGRQTIVFEPGLCSQSGWYTLWLETEDTYTGKALEQKLGQFFMDATVLDLAADNVQKTYQTSGNDPIHWSADELEQLLTEEGELRLGLAPAPEGWTRESATITFVNTKRPDGDLWFSSELAQLRVYNQTYNVRKGLSLEEGQWRKVSTTNVWEYTYDLYLADLSEELPYTVTDADGGTVYRIPMVEGRNLIVYEIQSTNGVITTHEMVVDVSVKAEEWELSHEVTCAGDTENAISAEVWPVGLLGEALDLNESDTLDRNRYNFRETESRGGFVSSYTYERDVEDVEYFLVDRYGNISAKTLTIRDDYGNVRTIDSRPPEWIGFTTDREYPDYADMHDAYCSGDTFYFEVYAWDNGSEIDPRDVTITFDADYSAVLLRAGGTVGEDGRFTMPLPLALDENGELLKNEDGTYAVWQSMDTNHNGIFKTQVIQTESEQDHPGYISIAVVGAWKYDETLTDTTRTLTVNVYDAHKNQKSADLQWSTNNDPYLLGVYAGDQGYGFGALNADGVLGLVSDVPFASIEGHGTGEPVQIIDDWAGFRNYYTEAPMITRDSPVIGEDEYGDPIYEPYRFTVTDLFGQTYTLDFVMDMYGDLGIDVDFSTTKPTNESVTVYAEATGNIERITSIVAEDGTEGTVDPEDPGRASIVMEENGTVTIQTDAGNERVVRVSNIDKTLGEAYVVYYNESYDVLNPAVGASQVTAVLRCDTEYLYTINGPESYTFPVGSRAGDTYTFEYRDAAGNAGTITAVLPVDLAIPEGPDTEAPDVNVGIYAGVRGSYELIERYDNPEYDAAALESRLTARINDPAYGGVRAGTMRLVLNIQDNSPVKVLAMPTGSDAPADYASATQGSTVDGVTLTVSRNTATLDITKNLSFDLYVIDEQGNLNANRVIRITSIDDQAPELVPSYEVSIDPETGASVVTATFYPTDGDLFAEITALSADIQSRQEVVTDTNGRKITVTRYYHVFDRNGTYSFRYEDDLGNIGVAQAEVLGLTTDPARVISAAWYGTRQGTFSNVLPGESDFVSRDVTAQLRMSKAISSVELFVYDAGRPDGIGTPLPQDAPVEVTWKNSVIDVVYRDNVDYEILVRFTASGNGRKGTYVLSSVECIDKELPQVTLRSAEPSEDKRSIVFTFDSSEDVIFSMDPGKGMAATHQWIARDDKPMTLYFTDKAGNQRSYLAEDFTGLDLGYLEASFSASADGADPTDEPAIDLTLNVGDILYVYVSKNADADLNGRNLGRFTADAWNPIVIPDEPGVHVLTLTDSNTGDVVVCPVYAKAVDRIAPVITFDHSTVLVNQGVSAEEMLREIQAGVNVTDNLDTAVPCDVAGYPENTMQSGLYTLTYTAEDSAGNRVTANRYLYILEENMPILWINGEVGLPYSTVYLSSSEISLTMENMEQLQEQPLVIKYAKGMLTTGQMKYSGIRVEDLHFRVEENGYYTIHVRAQDRTEFVTYLYVEG